MFIQPICGDFEDGLLLGLPHYSICDDTHLYRSLIVTCTVMDIVLRCTNTCCICIHSWCIYVHTRVHIQLVDWN